MNVIYPAPRWFREAVARWLDETPADKRHRSVDVLFTRLIRAQPVELRVVAPVKDEPPLARRVVRQLGD